MDIWPDAMTNTLHDFKAGIQAKKIQGKFYINSNTAGYHKTYNLKKKNYPITKTMRFYYILIDHSEY